MTGCLLLPSWGAARAQGDQAFAAEALVFNCFTCHGTDGKSPASMPSLAGKSSAYLARKLTEFKSGRTQCTIMDRVAKGYTDEEIARIAQAIAKLR
jgi:cytochrome c553